MGAASHSQPHSRSHMLDKRDAKCWLAIAGRTGLTLIVYLFWPWVHLPDAVGLPRREAQASTIAALVKTVPIPVATPPIAPDHPSGQYFLAGLPTLTPAVAAPTSIPVPPVAGQPGASAIAALDRAGFKSQRQEEPSETIPPGRVIGTSPSAGALVDKGSTVMVIVAVPVRISVPRVVGQRAGDATAALGRVGLKSQRREQSSARVMPGTVISTLPIAGQPLEKGATVTLVIAKAVSRDSPAAMPPLPPNGTGTIAPWMAGPRPTASSAGVVPPTTPSSSGPPSGAATVAPPTPAAPPAPAVLSGDALIGHLYDNAHGGR